MIKWLKVGGLSSSEIRVSINLVIVREETTQHTTENLDLYEGQSLISFPFSSSLWTITVVLPLNVI